MVEKPLVDADQIRAKQLDRVYGSMPWLKTDEQERARYRVKVFKSGNSVAVRLPAALGLKAGTEMDLDVEKYDVLSLTPVEPVKRKFNIAKVAGSARDLRFIDASERAFEDAPLRWDPRAPADDIGK